VLSEKKILNKTKNHNPSLQLKWSVPNHQKWYDSSLINFKRNLDDRLNLLLKYGRDPHVRSQYFSSLKQYRKLRKMISRQYRQEIINKLDSLYESNPKEYWKLLDQLKSKDNSFSEDVSHVPENEWYDYFKHLNEDTFTDKKIDELLNDLEKILIGSYTSPYLRSGISSTSVRNSVCSRVERSGTSGKTLNFFHEWKKSQIFNKDECKYLFLPFQLKNKACRFHSFIRMSMSCLLHKILQRHVQCSKYTLI
jgi:hypothetical protein